MLRLVLDYHADEYIFPDGRTIPRGKVQVLRSFQVSVPHEKGRLEAIVAKEIPQRWRGTEFFQAYRLSWTIEGTLYSVHLLSLQLIPKIVTSDSEKYTRQCALYKQIVSA